MDLGAYAQIEDLSKVAKENGIEVPRLRGYRLMKDEEPVPTEDIKRMMDESAVDVCVNLCRARPFWKANANCYSYGWHSDLLLEYYLVKDVDENGYKKYTGIRWDRIHGKKRKALKLAIKHQKKRIQQQFETWNKYVGNPNILYIHARIGGWNWGDYGGSALAKQPWFLEKVDDYFDDTYCDIYALIK